MSVVVAVKTLTGMVLASDRQVTCACLKGEASKIHQFEYSNTAIGCVGALRDGNLVSIKDELIPYKDILAKSKVDLDFVISKVVPALIDVLKEGGRLSSDSDVISMDSRFLFVTPKQSFIIYGDFSVVESDTPYASIGCGDEKAYGFLASYDNYATLTRSEAEKLAKDAIQKACEKDPYINEKVDMIFLEDK